jgi:hypothetical protein
MDVAVSSSAPSGPNWCNCTRLRSTFLSIHATSTPIRLAAISTRLMAGVALAIVTGAWSATPEESSWTKRTFEADDPSVLAFSNQTAHAEPP